MATGEGPELIDDARELTVAPAWRLWAGVGVAAASVLLHPISGDVAHVVGWFLGSAVTISFVGAFRRGDLKASTSPWYSPRPELDAIAVGVLAVGFASAVLHAWFFSQGQGL